MMYVCVCVLTVGGPAEEYAYGVLAASLFCAHSSTLLSQYFSLAGDILIIHCEACYISIHLPPYVSSSS